MIQILRPESRQPLPERAANVLISRLFEPASVRQLIADHVQNRIDGTDRILALLNLEVWSRIYLDDRSPDDVAAELKATLA